MLWPESGNTISPSLATGVEAGEGNSCVGIVLDTFSGDIPNQKMFKPSNPEGFTKEQLEKDPHEKWFNHPAPHAVPAVSFKTDITTPDTQGFLSPGPNLAGSYFAPWPRYYAYQPNEPIPVLTRGITTARIGAAYNIAQVTYGIKQQISATDESWVPVSCIPLFEGERLEAGSYIYASVKGNIITSGPLVDTPNPITGITSKEYLGQTEWDVFVDATWGNIGWAGTPGLSFSTIPDQGNNIMDVLEDENGQRETIPYLNQANQGSIIVHPVSSNQPTPSLGNRLSFEEGVNTDGFTIEEIKIGRFNLPGVSGRGMLSQSVPEKAQPIGIVMETVVGTGKWTYTGLQTNPDNEIDESVILTTGGVVYGDPSTLGNTPLRGGTGTSAEGAWTGSINTAPNLGTLEEPLSLPVPGVGYSNGDILTFRDNSVPFSLTPQYISNNASVTYDTTGPSLTLQLGGSGYLNTLVSSWNGSKNNAYTGFRSNGAGNLFETNKWCSSN